MSRKFFHFLDGWLCVSPTGRVQTGMKLHGYTPNHRRLEEASAADSLLIVIFKVRLKHTGDGKTKWKTFLTIIHECKNSSICNPSQTVAHNVLVGTRRPDCLTASDWLPGCLYYDLIVRLTFVEEIPKMTSECWKKFVSLTKLFVLLQKCSYFDVLLASYVVPKSEDYNLLWRLWRP